MAEKSNTEQVSLFNSDDGNVVFNFKLPESDLALRSVAVVKGVPEIRFGALPKAPTLQEEDIATVFRLVSEGERPEFYYLPFPISHPLHPSRSFKHYSPAWLRGTSVGELLAECDWAMKCLQVGTKSNKEKSSFESWSNGSQLVGLATVLDFPRLCCSGSVIMSCESVKIEIDDNELAFPKEPKMKITDETSPLYSEYITEIYPSVAYFDEPLFLKMQELIKLILAVEWLYNKKGVRVSREWITQHTSKKPKPDVIDKSKKPPYEMIPKPIVFKRPSSDVTVKTREADINRYLQRRGVERRYGFEDFGGAEVFLFKEDGIPCITEKCMKVSIKGELKSALDDSKCAEIVARSYIPQQNDTSHFKDELLKQLPKDLHTKDSSDNDGMELTAFQPCALGLPALKGTTTLTATIDNYDKLFANEDPNTPIPIAREIVTPNVKSWKELVSEMSVPWPRVWQVPFIGVGEPTASGGISTRDFHVERKPSQKKQPMAEIQQKDGFKRSGDLLAVPATQGAQGSIQLGICEFHEEDPLPDKKADRENKIMMQGSIKQVRDTTFQSVSRKFTNSWKNGHCPQVHFIFSITNPTLKKKWTAYQKTLQSKEIEECYHGTRLVCNITATRKLCNAGNCGICGIACAGLDPRYMEKNKRYGLGFYLALNSSKSHNYTSGANGYKAMLLCKVLPGMKRSLEENMPTLTSPPYGYDSISGGEPGFPELVVYESCAVLPRYIIVYQHQASS